jgi:carotenoid phi-ring synthase / carotenoid chi-ring synthase
MEHGFHGFFQQYYNLNDLLARAGVGDDLVPADGYPVLFRDRPEERFGTTTSLFPANLASVIVRSPSMHFRDFKDDGPGLTWLMAYAPADTYRRFDGQSFEEFIRAQGIHGAIVDEVLRPFGKTTLNAIDRLSAAEAIRFFHAYFMGNPEGLGFRYLKRDSMTAVIEPLAKRLVSLGANVRTGVAARRVIVEGGRVAGVAVDGATRPIPATSVEASAVPPTGWLRVDSGDGLFFVGRRGGELVAYDGRCTHMGCPVAPDPDGPGFRCPCHAGRYDGDGRPIAGPPKRALPLLPIAADGAKLRVGGGAAPDEELLGCDYCVVACEVRGLRTLVSASDLGPDARGFSSAVARLGEADPYVVARFWLDRPTRPDRSPFYTVSGYRYTDSIAVYSNFQEPYVSWARQSRGSVIESHAYAIEEPLRAPLARYRDELLAELFVAFPELAGARVLHEEAMEQGNFTRFAPGDHARRPTTDTPIANLFLAGDHVRLPVPAFLMEGATVSGRLAANRVLGAEKLKQVEIPTVDQTGPLAGQVPER